jgi:hypothetical protein
LRLEPDPLLRPFEDERDFAVVRLRPPLEPRPFDQLVGSLLDDLCLELPRDPPDLRLEADV